MWIPYDIRSALKPEGDRAALAASTADLSQRDFVVGFFMRNPVTQAWELDIVAPPAGQELVLPGMNVTLSGNDAGKLTEAVYHLPAVSAHEALARSFDDLRLRLLGWGALAGRGMAIAGWRIADTRHGARWRCTPFRPSALNIDFALSIDPDLAPLAELAQRARNAPDAATRLLAASGVLSVACQGGAPLADCGADGLTITREMLVHAIATDAESELLDLPLTDFLALIQRHCRRLVTAEGMFAPVADGLADQLALSRHANLADLLAHRLIQAELRARRQARVAPPARPERQAETQPC